MQGKEISNVFVEEGVSGSVPLQDRPAGARLLQALKRGDTIVAPKLDRLFRSALDAIQTVAHLKAKGVRVWLLDLGDVTGNGMAKAFMTMAAAFAELERDQIIERVSGVKQDPRARGRYLGGHFPFGFSVKGEMIKDREEKVLTHVEVEQKIIAEIRELRAAGKPLRHIQSDIEERQDRLVALASIKRVSEEQPAA